MECPVTRLRPSTKTTRPIAFLAMALVALAASTGSAEDDAPNYDETGSFYIDYQVGISHSPEGTLRGNNSSSIGLFGSTEQAPVGYYVGGSFGGYVADNVRLELQVSYRNSEIDNMSVQGEPDSAKNGTISLFSVMYNAYYDFDLRDRDIPVIPWLGLGIGWGMPRIDAQNQAGPMQLDIDDTDSTMIYNFMGGATYPLSDQAEVILGYRYIASIEFELRGTESGNLRSFEYEYGAHEGYTGIRFKF